MATNLIGARWPGAAAGPDWAPAATAGYASVAEQRDGDHMDWDGGGAWFMFGMMAIFWVGVIALGWWAIASYNRRHESARESPIDIARHRYARGEISAEEFERLKKDLG